MARMNLICQNPPEYTSENGTLIRVEKAKVSQSVFASMLNVSVSAVQKWESPSSGKHPSGAAAKLLQLIRRRSETSSCGWPLAVLFVRTGQTKLMMNGCATSKAITV